MNAQAAAQIGRRSMKRTGSGKKKQNNCAPRWTKFKHKNDLDFTFF
jgi:hypothetical protein